MSLPLLAAVLLQSVGDLHQCLFLFQLLSSYKVLETYTNVSSSSSCCPPTKCWRLTPMSLPLLAAVLLQSVGDLHQCLFLFQLLSSYKVLETYTNVSSSSSCCPPTKCWRLTPMSLPLPAAVLLQSVGDLHQCLFLFQLLSSYKVLETYTNVSSSSSCCPPTKCWRLTPMSLPLPAAVLLQSVGDLHQCLFLFQLLSSYKVLETYTNVSSSSSCCPPTKCWRLTPMSLPLPAAVLLQSVGDLHQCLFLFQLLSSYKAVIEMSEDSTEVEATFCSLIKSLAAVSKYIPSHSMASK